MTDLKESSEEDVAKEVVKLAYENGINFFDCADAYSGGAAERFFGEVLKEFPEKRSGDLKQGLFPDRRWRE